MPLGLHPSPRSVRDRVRPTAIGQHLYRALKLAGITRTGVSTWLDARVRRQRLLRPHQPNRRRRCRSRHGLSGRHLPPDRPGLGSRRGPLTCASRSSDLTCPAPAQHPRRPRRGVEGCCAAPARNRSAESRSNSSAKTQAEKAAELPHARTRRLRAIAADPHLVTLAERMDAATDAEPGRGGRPRAKPTWAMLLFTQAISIYKSASAVERELADADMWDIVCRAVQTEPPADDGVPRRAPTRHHYLYFTRRLAKHQVPLTHGSPSWPPNARSKSGWPTLLPRACPAPPVNTPSASTQRCTPPRSAPWPPKSSTRPPVRSAGVRRDPARGLHREGGTGPRLRHQGRLLLRTRSPCPDTASSPACSTCPQATAAVKPARSSTSPPPAPTPCPA